MIRLVEILASVYITKLRELNNKIDWKQWGNEYKSIQVSILNIIDNIENIHNYEGESATKYLNKLKNQAKAAIYILNNLLENQK